MVDEFLVWNGDNCVAIDSYDGAIVHRASAAQSLAIWYVRGKASDWGPCTCAVAMQHQLCAMITLSLAQGMHLQDNAAAAGLQVCRRRALCKRCCSGRRARCA